MLDTALWSEVTLTLCARRCVLHDPSGVHLSLKYPTQSAIVPKPKRPNFLWAFSRDCGHMAHWCALLSDTIRHGASSDETSSGQRRVISLGACISAVCNCGCLHCVVPEQWPRLGSLWAWQDAADGVEQVSVWLQTSAVWPNSCIQRRALIPLAELLPQGAAAIARSAVRK